MLPARISATAQSSQEINLLLQGCPPATLPIHNIRWAGFNTSKFESEGSPLPDLDVFPQIVGADIGGIDVAHFVGPDAGRRGTPDHLVEVGGIGDEGRKRAVPGVANHDAAPSPFLRAGSRNVEPT